MTEHEHEQEQEQDKKTDEFDWPHLTFRTHLLIIGGAALAAVITFLMIYLAVR